MDLNTVKLQWNQDQKFTEKLINNFQVDLIANYPLKNSSSHSNLQNTEEGRGRYGKGIPHTFLMNMQKYIKPSSLEIKIQFWTGMININLLLLTSVAGLDMYHIPN